MTYPSDPDKSGEGPEYHWTKDAKGRVVNDALGIWFVWRSYRDGAQGVFLPVDEPPDGKPIASSTSTATGES